VGALTYLKFSTFYHTMAHGLDLGPRWFDIG